MKTSSIHYKYQHLGKVFHLVEQFDLISRTDLAKLSGFAPASMTMLTKLLIEYHFILERSAQNLPLRGRPSVGLAISPFHWHFLCLTISPQSISISLCDLTGDVLSKMDYSLDKVHYVHLAEYVTDCLTFFSKQYPLEQANLIAVSVSVLGKVNADKSAIIQLGNETVNCPLREALSHIFHCPVLLNEHFQLWFLTESTLGSLIRNDNVMFLQLDDTINLSVLLKGTLLHQNEHKRMSVDKMMMPRFSSLSDEITTELNEMERYQLVNQVRLPALAKLIDKKLPNQCNSVAEKITHFCEAVERSDPQAVAILDHIADNLAYMLMNLINLFSIEKIMLNSPLLRIKSALFQKIQTKLSKNLLRNDLKIDLVTSQYDWNSATIPSVAVKLGIYEGNLLKDKIILS